MAAGSPPELWRYTLSGNRASCTAMWCRESGEEYTPFISLNTTPLYLAGEGGGGGGVRPGDRVSGWVG